MTYEKVQKCITVYFEYVMMSTGSCLEQGAVTPLMETRDPGNFLNQPLHKKVSIIKTTKIHKLLLYLLTPLPKPISGAVSLTTVYDRNKKVFKIFLTDRELTMDLYLISWGAAR
jgi:hypothetical protein